MVMGRKSEYKRNWLDQFQPLFAIAVVVPVLIACWYAIQLIEALKHNWGYIILGLVLSLTPVWWRCYRTVVSYREERKDRQMYRDLLQVATQQAHMGYNLELTNVRGEVLKLTNPYVSPVRAPVAKVAEALPELPPMAPVVSAPMQHFLLGQLPQNKLLVSPGVRRSNGEIVAINITEIPHLKIIGSSGFGKSCLAASLLDQATTLNSPDILQIALLDLEHKTSRIFEHRSHVAEFQDWTTYRVYGGHQC